MQYRSANLLLAALAVAMICPSASADDLEVRLVPATQSLSVLDPVYVRVDLLNHGDRELTVYPRLGSEHGTVQFQRRDKDDAWQELDLPGEGMRTLIVRTPSTVLPARQLSSFEVLFRSREGRFVFDMPGRHQVRAKVIVGEAPKHPDAERRTLYSPSITFDVEERFGPDIRRIISSADLLSEIIAIPGINERVPMEKLQSLAQQTQPSVLQQNLLIVIEICKLRQATSADTRRHAFAAVQEARQQMGEVMSEAIGIVLAHELLEMNAWEELKQVLDSLHVPTDFRGAMRFQLDLKRKD